MTNNSFPSLAATGAKFVGQAMPDRNMLSWIIRAC